MPGEKQRRSEHKNARKLMNLSPPVIKGGPQSVVSREQLPSEMKEFYSDLSGSSGSEASDHLDRLKSLFKSSNLAKQCSKPGKRSSLPYQKHRNISMQVPCTIIRHQTSKSIGKQDKPKVLYKSQIPDKLRIP